jgi:hypothetical protein
VLDGGVAGDGVDIFPNAETGVFGSAVDLKKGESDGVTVFPNAPKPGFKKGDGEVFRLANAPVPAATKEDVAVG